MDVVLEVDGSKVIGSVGYNPNIPLDLFKVFFSFYHGSDKNTIWENIFVLFQASYANSSTPFDK